MPFVTKARRKIDPVLRGATSKFTKYEREIYNIYMKAFAQMPNDLNNTVTLETIRAAIAASNPSGGAVGLQWGNFVSALDKSIPTLANQLAASANISAKALPKKIQIASSFTGKDPRAIAWAQQRAGARILGITKESQKAVAETIANGLKGKLNREEVVEAVTRSVGLDSRQARALGTFYEKNLNLLLEEGLTYENAARLAKKLGSDYRKRLITQRATRIARTETNAAANAGRMLSWAEADEQGLLPVGSQKRWKTSQDERNCSICRPMHNELVAWEGAFSTGDVMPPNHVNCLCTAVIVPADAVYEKSVEKRYYRFADGEKTWRNYDYKWRKIANEMKDRIGKCQKCGSKSDLTVDHIKRLKDGGAKYDRKNLRVLCRACNGKMARLGTKLRKDAEPWWFAKHAPGRHSQKTHGGKGGGGAKFFESGGQITQALSSGNEELGTMVATLDIMQDLLGEEFTTDRGVKFTRDAIDIEGEPEGTKVRVAYTEDGVAGAIQYFEMDKENIKATYGSFMGEGETMPEPHIYIAYLGSTGLVDKTGSALAGAVFSEAAKKNIGISLESADANASAFWEKIGMKRVEQDSGFSFTHTLTANQVQELVSSP